MLTASYAKINLFLEVTGKLPNNYHQVNTVLCSIDLFDLLSYSLCDNPDVSFSCNIPSLDNNENLVYRIADYLQKKFRIKQGVAIHLEKHIPTAAGLGGGSSNAANCLIALNDLWQLNISEIDLHGIAASFGSDINFFLQGGTALGENRGEQTSPLPDILLDKVLLINPNIPIPSSLAYKLVDIPSPAQARHFDPSNLSQTCFNRLEPGIRKVFPIIDSALNTLHNFGAEAAMLSGSGSTCFGIFTDEAAMLRCKQHFMGLGFWCHCAKTLAREDIKFIV
jgi:4-diphosphocytidyl-2-C-methyl-D-erythritol kinase